jgi:SPX domain protein involved in polyphosphate accumulation
MKFAKLLANTVNLSHPSWRSEWIDYKLLKKLLYSITTDSDGTISDVKSESNVNVADNIENATQERKNILANKQLHTIPTEVIFFQQLMKELQKVSVFYSATEEALYVNYKGIMAQFRDYLLFQNGSLSATIESMVKFFMMLIQLENYAVMNYCGFGKALKKHDKLTNMETKAKFMQKNVNIQSFAHYKRLLQMVAGIEQAYKMALTLLPPSASVMDSEDAARLAGLRVVKQNVMVQKQKGDTDSNDDEANIPASQPKRKKVKRGV